MSPQVEFVDENNMSGKGFRSRSLFGQPTTPTMVKMLLKLKIAKDEKTAGNILLVVAVICILGAIAIGAYQIYLARTTGVRYHISNEVLRVLPTEVQDRIKNNGK